MAFWEGVLAGYGIAIPVGAIAILIIDVALRRGFSFGFMAGAGAATVDLLYATIAAVAGLALASFLAPFAGTLRLASAAVLIALGSYGLMRVWQQRSGQEDATTAAGNSTHFKTFSKFFGLTLLNPLTIAYFGALILGRNQQSAWTTSDSLAFILGAGLASLSWQTLLAGTGATARHYLSPKFRIYASVVGNLIVIALGVRILFQLYIL